MTGAAASDFAESDESVQEAPEPDSDLSANGQQLMDRALALCEQSQQLWSAGEQEKAIDCLDQAYDLILKVDTQDDPELTQQKEDLRFMISRRVMEIYSSRFSGVSGNHGEIPLVMNQYVEREINSFQTT
ncbi:MAG: lytic transglycosylase, partial [Thermodesulfovibrionales bacterium]